jgi:hypothetical protein
MFCFSPYEKRYIPESVGYLNQAMLYNNNIKNSEGINGENLGSCLEQVFMYGPKTPTLSNDSYVPLDSWNHYSNDNGSISLGKNKTGNKDSGTVRVRYTVMDILEGDYLLAQEFYETYSWLYPKRKDHPFYEISNGGFGINLEFAFLEYTTKTLKKHQSSNRIYPGEKSIVSDIYKRYITARSFDMLDLLVREDLLVPTEELEDPETKEVMLAICDFIEIDLDERFTFFSKSLGIHERKYTKREGGNYRLNHNITVKDYMTENLNNHGLGQIIYDNQDIIHGDIILNREVLNGFFEIRLDPIVDQSLVTLLGDCLERIKVIRE